MQFSADCQCRILQMRSCVISLILSIGMWTHSCLVGLLAEVKATMNVPGYYFPWDHQLWLQLQMHYNRSLVTPLPSYSTHGEVEFMAPLIDWEAEALQL